MQDAYLQQFLSDSSKKAKRSIIRELLKLTSRPGMISLAGGFPSPETFPLEELIDLLPTKLREHGTSALQYGLTEGDPGLIEELIKLLASDDMTDLTPENVLITSASQQGLDILGRVFLGPGDVVICGLPSYLGAISAFGACGARMEGVPLDDDGIRPDLIEQRIIELRREGIRPKIIYLVPDFQNPAGVTLTLDRRLEILDIAAEFDTLVVEDSPYRMLRYAGEHVPSMQNLDREGRVITIMTFSKILFPGLRLGWMIAHPKILQHFVVAKQPLDLCTSPFGQFVAREFMRTGRMHEWVERTCNIYAKKRLAFLNALEKEMNPEWGVKWTKPEGGLFLWMTLPRGLEAMELFNIAIEENVAFVVGTVFHCDGGGQNTMRLNFSFCSAEQLVEAARRLARAIEKMIKDHPEALREAEPSEEAPKSGSRGKGRAGRKTEAGRKTRAASGDHSLEDISLNLGRSEVVE